MTDRERPLVFVVLDTPAQQLGVNLTDKAVLQCLVGHLNAKRNGTEVWPSNARIAELTGAHPETVVKAKVRLHEQGLIKIRRDSGKSDMCTIMAEVIRARANPPVNTGGSKPATPRKKPGGQSANPPGNTGGYPPEKTGDTPPEIPPRTAKGTTKATSQPEIPFVGCSTNLRVQDGDHQRRMRLLGVVAEGVCQQLADDREQPTEERTEERAADDRHALPAGMRRVRERPG